MSKFFSPPPDLLDDDDSDADSDNDSDSDNEESPEEDDDEQQDKDSEDKQSEPAEVEVEQSPRSEVPDVEEAVVAETKPEVSAVKEEVLILVWIPIIIGLCLDR